MCLDPSQLLGNHGPLTAKKPEELFLGASQNCRVALHYDQ